MNTSTVNCDEQEPIDDCCFGVHYPTNIGDLFNRRYCVLRKLGSGFFSTVWLCIDMLHHDDKDDAFDCSRRPPKFVALKISKAGFNHADIAKDEIQLLGCANEGCLMQLASDGKRIVPSSPSTKGTIDGRTRIVQLLDNFTLISPNGEHVCMVFELLGRNLQDLIRRDNTRGLPLTDLKLMVKQLLQGLDHLHRTCHIIHTDLKPENLAMCASNARVRQLVADSLADLKAAEKANKKVIVVAKSTKKQSSPRRRRWPHSFKWIVDRHANARQEKRTRQRQRQRKAQRIELEKPTTTQQTSHSRWPKVITKLKNYLKATNETADDDDDDGEEQQWPQVKIVDLGNACWTHFHFCEEIQTAEYRAPEVVLGTGYTTSVDMWSLACVAFELATGDYLFNLNNIFRHRESTTTTTTTSGSIDFVEKRHELGACHLVLMIEMLGPLPFAVAMSGEHSLRIFADNQGGKLKHMDLMCRPLPIAKVLIDIYGWSSPEAVEFADFLLPMLAYDQSERASAADMLQHPWITGVYPSSYSWRTTSWPSLDVYDAYLDAKGFLRRAVLPPNDAQEEQTIAQNKTKKC